VIDIVVNGRTRSVDEGLTVHRLLERLEVPLSRLAVERNHRLVPRDRYASEPVEAGDRLEIVTLVGGG
jgi:thiamine biosynthesis protein ThiS